MIKMDTNNQYPKVDETTTSIGHIENIFDFMSAPGTGENVDLNNFENIFDDESVQSSHVNEVIESQFKDIFNSENIPKEITAPVIECQESTSHLEIDDKTSKQSGSYLSEKYHSSFSNIAIKQTFPAASMYGDGWKKNIHSNIPPIDSGIYLHPKNRAIVDKNVPTKPMMLDQHVKQSNISTKPLSFEQRFKRAEMAGKPMNFERNFEPVKIPPEPMNYGQHMKQPGMAVAPVSFEQRLREIETKLVISMERSEETRANLKHMIHQGKAQRRHSVGVVNVITSRKRSLPSNIDGPTNSSRRRVSMGF